LNSAAVIGRNRIGSIPAIIDGSGWPLLGRQLRSFPRVDTWSACLVIPSLRTHSTGLRVALLIAQGVLVLRSRERRAAPRLGR
jgi:hypothetical protein